MRLKPDELEFLSAWANRPLKNRRDLFEDQLQPLAFERFVFNQVSDSIGKRCSGKIQAHGRHR